ncbi:MAG: DnaA regulatory inactivator Hda [Pseudomonadota bacterium]|nr:DnaA regulatory inactivator Hda [Pseudomonadota bacterium]MDQ3159694.1 DnaA regulatory inactivator Hda [Pseudomonadota bacterium]
MSRSQPLVPQLPLALRFPPEQRLLSYMGAANGLIERLQLLAEGGLGEALYVQGAKGSGKTHLLLGTCAAAEAVGRRPQYLSLKRVRGRARSAFEGLELTADLVALDDLDAICGAHEDEVALFDLHNRLHDAGTSVLYAATTAPAMLQIALPDLRSRLAQCTLMPLHALDDAGRAAVLRQRATSRGMLFEDAALDWLLSRCSRDLSDLAAMFEKIDRASLAAQRRITVPFLRQVLDAG